MTPNTTNNHELPTEHLAMEHTGAILTAISEAKRWRRRALAYKSSLSRIARAFHLQSRSYAHDRAMFARHMEQKRSDLVRVSNLTGLEQAARDLLTALDAAWCPGSAVAARDELRRAVNQKGIGHD